MYRAAGSAPLALSLDDEYPYRSAIAHTRARARERLGEASLAAIVRRVVHGGGSTSRRSAWTQLP